jgi:16S rRNA G966 N2-methylase RsmD
MRALKVEYLTTQCLKCYKRNARSHSKKQIRQIAASIERFGFTNPLLIDKDDMILAGHGRLAAARLLGLSRVPCVRLDHMTPAEKQAYVIADNKLALNAGWDEELLAQELSELLALDANFDISLTGFSIAAHRLICANALVPQAIAILMDGEQAQMVFSDPPYNVPIQGHVSGLGQTQHREFAMASGEMSRQEFTAFLTSACRNLADYSCDGAIHYLCMDWRHMGEMLAAGSSVYGELKNFIVWVKDNGGMGSFYRSRHELIFAFKKGEAPHINSFELGQHGRYRTNVWQYKGMNSFGGGRSTELGLHPTVKPVAMIADAIKDVSQRNGIVLDLFGGSGSTLIAAHKTGRRGYLCELDPLSSGAGKPMPRMMPSSWLADLEEQTPFVWRQNERGGQATTLGPQGTMLQHV